MFINENDNTSQKKIITYKHKYISKINQKIDTSNEE